MRVLSFLLLASAFAVSARAQVVEHKLTASDGSNGDRFGWSVSIDGTRALVGAIYDEDWGPDSGSAYVFEWQINDSWLQVAKLIASDGDVNDNFGGSVALSGDRAIVGSVFDDDLGTESGSAYVFERQQQGTWQETAKLTASDGDTGDFFGVSVSTMSDRALIGASGDGVSRGSAYLLELHPDGSWHELTKLTASDGSDFDTFGNSVSLAVNRALVGAEGNPGFTTGAVYVFERQSDGSWLEVAKLTASDGALDDRFGRSVSLFNGDRAIIGACLDDDRGNASGSAYVFERQADGSWMEITKLTASDGAPGDEFGNSVSLWGDRAIVTARGEDDPGSDSGAAYLFERQGDSSWLEVAKFTASDAATEDSFGRSVSLSGDRAIIGASYDDDNGDSSGSAYVYENIFSVSADQKPDIAEGYLLSVPHPNPFNPRAQFSLDVGRPQHVQIEVFDTLGQRVEVLYEGLLSGRGTHLITFEAGSLPSGVYLLRVTGETFSATRTMTLLK